MNKRIRTSVKRRLEINDATGIEVARNFHFIVVEAGGYEALTFDERDARNHIENARKLRLGPQHRWCLWHVMKKIPEKLRGYSQYESIKFTLQNAVYDSFTKTEFDEEWQTMLAKFSLYDNEWLGWFEFRGIICAHPFSVLIERCIYEVPNKYIVERWRKDLE
ncbi:protein FAR1-RELATED SEQUENCE 6-like [Camellia sinensis]|uniref:protein FAR1-RELATED SEQUENCE 6-like n=1 Tax=Camellia sinensis TaxID=4442 RepID=UPI001035C32F|nr:protein FAR1-RELATED SEQUENCE 6-like [Camellia sinensis]